DDAPLVFGQDVSEAIVVALDQSSTRLVTEGGEVRRRADDVGERQGEVPLEATQQHLGDELAETNHFREAHGFEIERHAAVSYLMAGRRSPGKVGLMKGRERRFDMASELLQHGRGELVADPGDLLELGFAAALLERSDGGAAESDLDHLVLDPVHGE